MRLIDADALPKWTGYALSATEIAIEVEHAPTIDAVPVKHGEWINLYGNQYKCSECGSTWVFGGIPKANYCADCGAKMDGERKDG